MKPKDEGWRREMASQRGRNQTSLLTVVVFFDLSLELAHLVLEVTDGLVLLLELSAVGGQQVAILLELSLQVLDLDRLGGQLALKRREHCLLKTGRANTIVTTEPNFF